MSTSERRTEIQDAAIAVLAEHGTRGLTHRAVDQRAGVPVGTTSNYFRTRASLALGTLDRLGTEARRGRQPTDEDLADLSAEEAVVEVARWFVEGGAPNYAEAMLAWYRLNVEDPPVPEIAAILTSARRSAEDRFAELVDRCGASDPRRYGQLVKACIDGVSLSVMTAARPEISADQMMRSMLRGIFHAIRNEREVADDGAAQPT